MKEIEVYHHYNVSTLFLMKPMTGIYLNDFLNAGGVKTYMYFEDMKGLFLLFKEGGNYDELLFSQRNNTNFVEERICDEYSVWVYKIPNELEKDYSLLENGEYSKLSNWWKKQYDKTVIINSKEIPSLQWRVFEKDDGLRMLLEDYVGMPIDRNKDYYQLPNKEKETLCLNTLLKK